MSAAKAPGLTIGLCLVVALSTMVGADSKGKVVERRREVVAW